MLTLKQIDQRIKTLRKSGYNTVNETVQEVAVSIVSHANDTGDCSRAAKLVTCLPAPMRSLLIGWFSEVSPIKVTSAKLLADYKCKLRKEGHKGYNPFDIERAKANKWFDDPFKVAPEPVLNTYKTYVDSYERLIDKMARETKENADKVEPADIERVKALRAHMRAAFVEFTTENPVSESEPPAETEEQGPAETAANAANAA